MRSYHIRKMVVLQKDEKASVHILKYHTQNIELTVVFIAKVQKILVVNGIVNNPPLRLKP